MRALCLFLLTLPLYGITIIDKPIIFDEERIALTKEYIADHYGLYPQNISITPRILVIHWTSINDFDRSYQRFFSSTLPSDRPDIKKASSLNVSAHFMIDRDGTIYRLMNETAMARHVIGLNYSAIGIENVGGKASKENLTPQQFKANLELIRYLMKRHPTLEYLIGHYEYTRFENHALWLEKQTSYRTLKHDPGPGFMQRLRTHIHELKAAP